MVKTSAAVNLACLASREGSTLLWDLDPQAAATFLFRIRPRVCSGSGRWSKAAAKLWSAARDRWTPRSKVPISTTSTCCLPT
jgi:cellulose biosynthesis protein BcsQ